MKMPSLLGIVAAFSFAIIGAAVGVWAAFDGAAWTALVAGFGAGGLLVFGVGDLRDRYRILLGVLR